MTLSPSHIADVFRRRVSLEIQYLTVMRCSKKNPAFAHLCLELSSMIMIKSSLQRSLPHKPTCDPLTPTYSLVQFVLAITCCSFGPIGRPDVLQLPLIASAESWSKIDSEGTLVGGSCRVGCCHGDCRQMLPLPSLFLLTRCDL